MIRSGRTVKKMLLLVIKRSQHVKRKLNNASIRIGDIKSVKNKTKPLLKLY
jgi:hypothetical protein